MFDRLRLFGKAGTILWGYRPAVEVTAWRIVQDKTQQWILVATPLRVDAFGLRQTPLMFTAPREVGTRDGFWSFGVEKMIEVGPTRIVAWIGPPER